MSVTTSQPPPRLAATSDWLRELVNARNEYEELLGWPVLLEVTSRRLVMRTGTALDAVVMPATLGEQVLAELRIAMLGCPVVAEPDGSWVFVTEPVDGPCPAMPPELISAQVRTLPSDSRLVLPKVLHRRGVGRSWVTACRRQPLAPWHAVIATSRRVIARGAEGNPSFKADVTALCRPAAA
jgi:hypothetical protein